MTRFFMGGAWALAARVSGSIFAGISGAASAAGSIFVGISGVASAVGSIFAGISGDAWASTTDLVCTAGASTGGGFTSGVGEGVAVRTCNGSGREGFGRSVSLVLTPKG